MRNVWEMHNAQRLRGKERQGERRNWYYECMHTSQEDMILIIIWSIVVCRPPFEGTDTASPCSGAGTAGAAGIMFALSIMPGCKGGSPFASGSGTISAVAGITCMCGNPEPCWAN